LQAFKWEVKQVTPLVRGLTGAAYSDVPPPVPRPSAHDMMARTGDVDAGDGSSELQSTSMTTDASATEDELPEPGTTRNLLAKFKSLQATTQ